MENQPTQQEPPLPPSAGGRAPGRSGTPPYILLLFIVMLALLFHHYMPRAEVRVPWDPWFLEQVRNDNIKSFTAKGPEIRGELVRDVEYRQPSGTAVLVHRFIAIAPSDDMVAPVLDGMINKRAEVKAKDGGAGSATANGPGR